MSDPTVSVADPVSIADKNPKRKKMSEFDQRYIIALMDKYPGDVKKMFRDLKLNYKQYSENQLEKLISQYTSLPPAQRISNISS